MSVSYHVSFVKDFSGSVFQRMMRVKLACEAARISYPEELLQYFGPLVVESEETIRREMHEVKAIYSEMGEEGCAGFEVKVKDIPKDVTAIRFRVCY